MKSKFDLKRNSVDPHSIDKTLEFVGLYKSVAETNKVAEKRKSDDNIHKETTRNKIGTPKREHSPDKNKKRSKQEPVDIPQVNIDGSNLHKSVARSGPTDSSKVTPNTSGKSQGKSGGVKSIMKNKSSTEQSLDSARSVSSGKPKKRNKSVSFMLEDNEEVMVKRTKSDETSKANKKTVNTIKTNIKDKRQNLKKFNKDRQSEKENKAAQVNSQHMDVDSNNHNAQEKKRIKLNKPKKMPVETSANTVTGDVKNQTNEKKEKKKKLKKAKKQKTEQSSEPTDTETNNNEVSTENKSKKTKNKKIRSPPVETTQVEGEPVLKSFKQNNPDIAEDLENLSIGDNAHTLTNLLDDMTVVDKDKRKKLRQKFNKNKKSKGPHNITKEDSEKNEDVKERVKWKKRKWNKDKKGDADEDSLANTAIVENLPIAIMLNYRKLLTEHFAKHGLIKKIGIAEVYPTEVSKPVFTTTITFNSDGAADQALQENNSYFEGSRISVKRALPATQTTLVVRSYAELTDQAISSAFLGAGKIRSIRHLVKGKKTMSTAFVEFDGPEAVERAIKVVGATKIGGKKIHLAKYEMRAKKIKKLKNEADSAADADSEDSND